MREQQWIVPKWPAPQRVKAVSTTRLGGVSAGIYASLNLGINTQDPWSQIEANRAILRETLELPTAPSWLKQVHGTHVQRLTQALPQPVEADGSITKTTGLVCVVLTADCLPILLCDKQGTQVAAVHGGWRGLSQGILNQAVAAFDARPEDLLAWLGPGISQPNFEVGEEVRESFLLLDKNHKTCFQANTRGRWQADLYGISRAQLRGLGVSKVNGGDLCTYAEKQRFFSYRRDGETGRMATLIWLT